MSSNIILGNCGHNTLRRGVNRRQVKIFLKSDRLCQSWLELVIDTFDKVQRTCCRI